MRALLGPFLFLADGSAENQRAGAIMLIVLVLCLTFWIVRPRAWSISLAALAAVAWLIVGILAEGIGC